MSAATAPGDPTYPSPVVSLRSALAGEHAAVYAYGIVGARVSPAQRPAVRAVYDAHRVRRDSLEARIRELGQQPVPAEPAYTLPFDVVDAAAARRLAALVEERLAALYADVVYSARDRGLRDLGASALAEAAVRAAQWSGVTVAFPGLPERG